MDASRIRQLRKDRGLTLAQASAKVGTDAGNLSRVERGEQSPSIELARKLAWLYEVPVDQVVGGALDPAAA